MFACNQALMISLRGTQIRYLQNIVGAHCAVRTQQLLTSVELNEEENQNDPQLQLQREKDIR